MEELNLLLPPERRLAPTPSTPIIGDGASLDSLGFLNFIMLAETKLNQQSPAPINLAERLLEDPSGDSPETLGQLAALVASLQEDHAP